LFGRRDWLLGSSSIVLASLSPTLGHAAEAPVLLDRVAVRFWAPESGNVTRPQFVFEHELSFFARLTALSDPTYRSASGPYRTHHLRAALERWIAETLLASLRMDPDASAQEIRAQTKRASLFAALEAGGQKAVDEAARAEGLTAPDVERLLRLRARASLYLDRMVAPMLRPSLLELERVHETERTPYSDRPFSEVIEPLREWVVAQSLRAAAQNFYQSARPRLRIEYLTISL
jgi:hypothetical protein